MDRLDALPFTTLFVTGNHSNYDLLKTYEVKEFCGGKVQFVRPSIIHLMRGQIFELEGKRFFTMGGASCHDTEGGILSLQDPLFEEKKWELQCDGIGFRVEHQSWWKEELPNEAEYREAWQNLKAANRTVDHIITHCPPESIRFALAALNGMDYPRDSLTDFLEQVKRQVRFKSWFFGHYHRDATILSAYHLCYQNIAPLESFGQKADKPAQKGRPRHG